ncbi:MAG: beta-ketoacyl synthase N-terminal-like domain-containing protein [Arachidicoccus sp.]|nr:beta-ketoacyl synthase N-terminal-like domain-containing protein [Arachidicoccus sp.]
MQGISIISDNIFSPLGKTTAENFAHLKNGSSGIELITNSDLSSESFYSSMFQHDFNNGNYTKFEQILIASMQDALNNCDINVKDKKTIFILSSTKGNIDLLDKKVYNEELKERIALHTSAKLIAEHFGFINKPLIISNACISGVLAILTAKRLLESGQYENAIIAGADIVSKFVLSGFQSFQAISSQPCKPFDANRSGLTLGETAGTLILSSDKKYSSNIKVVSGSVSNDANHLSAPSRTSEELSMAIQKTLRNANIFEREIDFISAHGTATLYNDEMEAKAISLSKLESTPVNSLKGFYGHTLGAAGIIESAVTIQSMRENIIIPTKGFEKIGVSKPVNICDNLQKKSLNNCLKIASGFGGCNAAILFSN